MARSVDLDRLTATLAEVLARTGPCAPAVLFFASFIEYVFPPFPGDTIVLLGAWYAVRGSVSWPMAFVAVTAGAMAGAWIDWAVGRALAPVLSTRAARRGFLDAERLAEFEAAYRRWGGLLLVANRFLPGIRAFLFVAAGASGIPIGRVLLLGGISAALWNALLLAVGALVVHSFAQLADLMARYTHAAWVVLAVGGVLVLAWLYRKRRARGR